MNSIAIKLSLIAAVFIQLTTISYVISQNVEIAELKKTVSNLSPDADIATMKTDIETLKYDAAATSQRIDGMGNAIDSNIVILDNRITELGNVLNANVAIITHNSNAQNHLKSRVDAIIDYLQSK